MSALHMIMQKWKQENVFRDHLDMDPNHVQLKIVMLGKLCGAVIGENGKTINDIKIATHTDIRVQVCGFRTITVSAVYARDVVLYSSKALSSKHFFRIRPTA